MANSNRQLKKNMHRFHQKIEEFRKQNAFEGKLEAPSLKHVSDDGVHEYYVRFIGIPQKATSGRSSKRKISVLLLGAMTPGTATGAPTLTAYNTEVLYCELEKPSVPRHLTAAHGFRYDYDPKLPHAHPVFHAHYDLMASNRWFTEHGGDLELSNGEEINCRREHRAIRIPTAQMDIFSVILTVAAGHWVNTADQDAVNSFAKLLESLEPIVPKVDLSLHGNLLGADLPEYGHLRAQSWYPV